MSDFQPKDGTGLLFRNERKEDGSSHPDYTGNATINGQPLDIAGWIKQGKKGKFLSLSFKPPRERYQEPSDQPRAKPARDDEPPF